MTALVKSLASMLLLVGVLSIPTVSAWGEGGEVKFIVEQAVEEGSVLKIVGNSSEFGDGTMTRDSDDMWHLIVTLTRGQAYEVWLAVNSCICNAKRPSTFPLPNAPFFAMINLNGYFDCNDCLPPTPSPPPPSPPDVEVTFVAHELLQDGEKMRLLLIDGLAIINVSMVLDPPDTWVADVKLTRGPEYEVILLHGFCPCNSTEPYIYPVPVDKDYDSVELTESFDCTNCLVSVQSKSMMFNHIRRLNKAF